MFSRTIYASRSMAYRAVRTQTRAFSRPAALQADLIQEMYVKEIKAYKPQPAKAGDAESHVQKFSVPRTPKSPEETGLTSELGSYEAQTVETESGVPTESGAAPVEEDWFQEEEETPAAGGH